MKKQAKANQRLRRKALTLARQHWWRLALLFAIAPALSQLVSLLLPKTLTDIERSLAGLAPTLLTAPLSIGLIAMALGLWRGQGMSLSAAFAPYRSGRMLCACVLLQLVTYLALTIPFIVLALMFFCLRVSFSVAVILLFAVLLLASLAAAIWLMYRLLLARYMLAEGDSLSVSYLVKQSFARMRGEVKPMLGFYLSSFWWLMLVVIGLPLLTLCVPAQGARYALMACSFIVNVVFISYTNLCMAGYVADRLREKL